MKKILYAATFYSLVSGSVAEAAVQGMTTVKADVYVSVPAPGLQARWIPSGGLAGEGRASSAATVVGRLEITNDSDSSQQVIVSSDDIVDVSSTGLTANFRRVIGDHPTRNDDMIGVQLVYGEGSTRSVVSRVAAGENGVDIAGNADRLIMTGKSTMPLTGKSILDHVAPGVYSGTFFIYNETM